MEENNDPVAELLHQLKIVCEKLGWELIMESEGQYIKGLVIGDSEYLTQVYSGEIDFSTYEPLAPSDDSGELH